MGNILKVVSNPRKIVKNVVISLFNRFSPSRRYKLVHKASGIVCEYLYVGKTKRRLHDRKTEHFKVIQDGRASAVAEHVISTYTLLAWKVQPAS